MKKEVCRYKEDHPSAKLTDLFRVFNKKWNTKVGMTTIREIIQQKDRWLSVSEQFEDIKRITGSRHQDIEEALFKLFLEARGKNEPISDEWLLKNAREIGQQMKVLEFRYSKGWLSRFKKRYLIAKSAASEPSTLVQLSAVDMQKPRCVVKKKLKPFWSVLEISADTQADNAGKCGIALKEAKEGLIKVIAFVSGLAVRDQYLDMLVELLNYLNTSCNSSEHLDITDAEIKREDMADVRLPNGVNTDLGDGNKLLFDTSELVEVKKENICDDGDIQCVDDFVNQTKDSVFDVANCLVDEQLLTSDQQLERTVKTEQTNGMINEICRDVSAKPSDKCLDYGCYICGSTFPSHRRRIKHMASVHDCDKPFKCSTCGKTFAKRCVLMIHSRIHTGEKPYLCTVCGKRVSAPSGLVIHMRSHSDDKPYTCVQCNKSFKCATRLAEHRRIHNGEKPFKCSTCNKAFRWSVGLTLHKRQHTGERPFKCIVCGKSYAKSSAYKVHMRKHTGEKPYTCPHCSKGFVQKSVLNTHMRIHTGEKPFICAVCGKKFTQSGSLYNHGRMHKK